jgi:peptidoglycan/xylan/chitin deacetylase (PgdA/CDA1 family)
MKARTLMYHDVEPSDGPRGGFDGSGPAVYAVAEQSFRDQLDAAGAAAGGPPSTADALVDSSAPRDAWLITFDDGGSSGVAAGAELARRSWRAHFFVVTGLVGTPGFMSWDELRALAGQGHVIGSHSATHPKLISSCPPAQIVEEWASSAEALARELGVAPTTASVPGGYYSPEVGSAAAAAGIRCLFTSEPVAAVRAVDGYLVAGRYAIRRDTTVAQVARAAAGDPRPWLRQRASWELRGVAKRIGGRHYQRLRTALLDRR